MLTPTLVTVMCMTHLLVQNVLMYFVVYTPTMCSVLSESMAREHYFEELYERYQKSVSSHACMMIIQEAARLQLVAQNIHAYVYFSCVP